MSVCIHGGLRRQCETCDLADRLEQAVAALLIAQELLYRNGIARSEIDRVVEYEESAGGRGPARRGE